MTRSDPEQAALSLETLLRYLESPMAGESGEIRSRVASSDIDRRNAEALVHLEAALVQPFWERALQEAIQDPVGLPVQLEARLLAIPERHLEESRTHRPAGDLMYLPPSGSAEIPQYPEPGTKVRRVPWTPLVALAALVLAGIAVWRFHGFHPEAGDTETPSIRWKGGTEVQVQPPPVTLWVQGPADGSAQVIEPPPGTTRSWTVRVPARARVQVHVARPERLPPDTPQWGAAMRMYEGGDPRRPLPVGVITARAARADPDVTLGGTLNLEALARHGVHPGDTLLLEVARGNEHWTVTLVIQPQEGGRDP